MHIHYTGPIVYMQVQPKQKAMNTIHGKKLSIKTLETIVYIGWGAEIHWDHDENCGFLHHLKTGEIRPIPTFIRTKRNALRYVISNMYF